MPNRKTHQPIAIIAGAIAGYACANNQASRQCIIETIGGGIGGWATGMLADKLDPPDHPHHRGIGHALIPNTVLAAGCVQIAADWQTKLRHHAADHTTIATFAPSGFGVLSHHLLELLCLALSGAIAGAIGGHWSHLYLDSQTTFGIPLLLRGC
jgi:membrane-bound metal-dependent hydrolase YbcI (DUF457 family)